MTKKILLIIGMLAVIGIALLLIFGAKPQVEGENRVGFSLREFLPFGKSDDTNTRTTTAGEEGLGENASSTTISGAERPIPRLRKISSEPVAGAVIFNTGTTSLVRFVEKGTGNVYEARSDSHSIQRLTNTTIPKIVRAFWFPNGSGFLAQTIILESEIVETSFVKLNKNTASTSNETLTPFGTTIGKLPIGIKEIAVRPDGAKIFYYTINGPVSNWFVSNPDGTNSSFVALHPLTEWLPKWISTNIIMLQTKGSSESIGYVYSFDVQNKLLKKTGVATIGISFNSNADGSFSLVSSGGNFPQLFLVNNQNASSTSVGVNSLAEKCVWLKGKKLAAYCAAPNQIPSGNYPDAWYKGTVTTEDFIETIDLNDNIYFNVINLSSESGQKIDVVDPQLSPDETHLIFRNKADGFLWLLRIEE